MKQRYVLSAFALGLILFSLEGCKSKNSLSLPAASSEISSPKQSPSNTINPEDEENSQDTRDDDGDDGTWGSGDTSANFEAGEPSQVVESAKDVADIKEAVEKTVSGLASILEAAQTASALDAESISADEIVILESVSPVEIQPIFGDGE